MRREHPVDAIKPCRKWGTVGGIGMHRSGTAPGAGCGKQDFQGGYVGVSVWVCARAA